ncbi:lysosome-associated membrane glycoprotein 5-like [Centruroides sculpturatus]|uniref:lysosome-associated membrane glycoprotein 5-like n=1 Tax=Centruroides sculpturatus TaxID=218467 RepID=UPI000C6D1976|nr:lysosome-associated membrane glycoprotein 5-like [Centruroides sculpturatus]
MVLWILPLLFSVAVTLDLSLDKQINEKATMEAITPSAASQEKQLTSEDSTSSSNEPFDKEVAPAFTFHAWDLDGKICILAKFLATFTIVYPSQGGDLSVSVNLPDTARTKGTCESQTDNPVLELSWSDFRLSMIFTRVPSKDKKVPDNWIISSIELFYNTTIPLFDEAINAGSKTARSEDNLTQFETSIGKSYFCPSPEVIPLYDTKKDKVATARLQDVRIQPFGISKGGFSQVQRCSQVRIGGMPEPFAQDETVPIAVGSTLTVLAIIVILGYALHRSMAVQRVDYSTME